MSLKTHTNKKVYAALGIAVFITLISLLCLFSEKTVEAGLAAMGFPESTLERLDIDFDGAVLTNLQLPPLGLVFDEVRVETRLRDLVQGRLGKILIKQVRWQPAANLPTLTGHGHINSGNAEGLKAVFSGHLVTQLQGNQNNTLHAEITVTRNSGIENIAIKATAQLKDLESLGLSDTSGKADVILQFSAVKPQQATYQDLPSYTDASGLLDVSAHDVSLAGILNKATITAKTKLTFDQTKHAVRLVTDETPLKIVLPEMFILQDGMIDLVIPLSNPLAATGRLSAALLSQHQPAWFTPLDINASLAPHPTQAQVTTGALTAKGLSGALVIKATGTHDHQARTGSLRVHMTQLNLQPEVRTLAEFFPITATYAQDVTGTIGAQGHLAWRQTEKKWQVTQHASLMLRDCSATYSDFPVVGINAVLNFDNLLPLVFQHQKIAIGTFTAGLPLQNGLLTLSLDRQMQLTTHAGQMELAGGHITVEPFVLDINRQQADIVLNADNLDLAQIFAMAPLEGLTAEGRMKGRLPIVMRNGALTLDNGKLESLAGGFLRYNPREMPEFLKDDTNRQIVDLRTALGNFGFSRLQMTLNGDLLKEQAVTLTIEGKNPDFYDGHPVKLNLNVAGPLQNIVKYTPGNKSIPDAIQKQIEHFEDANATSTP